jgi:hypothetical protein
MDGKSAKKGTKTGKNRTKNVKKVEKSTKFALAHLTKSTPSAEKRPRTPPPRPMGSKKPPKNTPQNLLKKVIHNRRRSPSSPCLVATPPGASHGRTPPGSKGKQGQDRPWHTPRGGQARRLNGRANVRRSAAGGESTLAMDLAGSYHNGIVLKGAGHLPEAGRGARAWAGGAANQEHADEIARLARRNRRQGRSGKPG